MFAGLSVKKDAEETEAQGPGGGMFAGLEMKADEASAAPGGGMFAGLTLSDEPAEGSGGTVGGGGMFAGLEMGSTRGGSNTIGGSEVKPAATPLDGVAAGRRRRVCVCVLWW